MLLQVHAQLQSVLEELRKGGMQRTSSRVQKEGPGDRVTLQNEEAMISLVNEGIDTQFKAADKNGDGMLDRSECASSLHRPLCLAKWQRRPFFAPQVCATRGRRCLRGGRRRSRRISQLSGVSCVHGPTHRKRRTAGLTPARSVYGSAAGRHMHHTTS